jgi:hypothetical protein
MLRVIGGKVYGTGGVGWPVRTTAVEEPLAIRESKLIEKLKERAYGGVHAKKLSSGHYENLAFYTPPRLWNNIPEALEKIRYANLPLRSSDDLSVVVKKLIEFTFYKFEPIYAFAFWMPIDLAGKKDTLLVGLAIPEDMLNDIGAMVSENPNFVFKVYRELFPEMAAKTKFRPGSKKALLDLGRSGTVNGIPVNVVKLVDYTPLDDLAQ